MKVLYPCSCSFIIGKIFAYNTCNFFPILLFSLPPSAHTGEFTHLTRFSHYHRGRWDFVFSYSSSLPAPLYMDDFMCSGSLIFSPEMSILGSSPSGIFLSQLVFLVSRNSICSYFSLPFSFMLIFKCSLIPIFLSFLGLFLGIIFSLLIIGEFTASFRMQNTLDDLIISFASCL